MLCPPSFLCMVWNCFYYRAFCFFWTVYPSAFILTFRSTPCYSSAVEKTHKVRQVRFGAVPEPILPILFRLLPQSLAAETFSEMDLEQQQTPIEAFSDRELRACLTGTT